MIQDDTFTEERAMEFSDAMLKAGIKIPWSCYARGNMSYEGLKLMKKAGLRNLHVGYESADPGVLKNIKKGVTAERMMEFTKSAHRAGVRIHADFAFGFNGETVESMLETINWAKELDPDTAQFQLMIPFPGTPYYELMKKNGWLNKDGEPDLPNLPNEEMRRIAKKAYREFYFSWRYMRRVIRHPYEHFFGRLDTIGRAIPALFWKRW
ncbi:MAG: radical SAM protein [Deltaproteobacteria bacterium]|nr:radical SAM protein [Deltaproteobacteria bacterium]